MKWYESYTFVTLSGLIGYIFDSVGGFAVGAIWATLVILVLSLFSQS